ncbi:helix-hairpin-helix domain-containing protein [Streptacidiphilus sp. EB103A]|uniref:DNA polymerase Y family protein n=1 Tax=Streptacidiphilus sp. EB103A TaxID=3156275 RepID=UPI003513F53D
MNPTTRILAHVRFHTTAHDPAQYRELMDLLEDITPLVQALPPYEAVADLTGAPRYWDSDSQGLAHLIQLRTLALHDITTTVATAPSLMLAAIALTTADPGHSVHLEDDPLTIQAFLRRQPLDALPGIGPVTARTLRHLGLRTVADVADLPSATLQRLVGATASRQIRERALGHDPRPVQPGRPAESAAAHHPFRHDELLTTAHRGALIGLADALGNRLRRHQQVARGIEVTVRYADRTHTTRSRRLPEPTAHTPDLATCAQAAYDALGLQRARVRSITLRCQDLAPAQLTPRQLSLDPRAEKARRVEAATDRARLRFGPGAVTIAAAATGELHRRTA